MNGQQMNASSKTSSAKSPCGFAKNVSSTTHNSSNCQNYNRNSDSMENIQPNSSKYSSSRDNVFPDNSAPVVFQCEEYDEVAELEKQAQAAIAKLEKAKAAKLGINYVGQNLYSAWDSTPAEVQKRATSFSHVTHSRSGNFEKSENHMGNFSSLKGHDNNVDYNMNVDYCNAPAPSIMNEVGSYNLRNGEGLGGDVDTPICFCGLPCVTLTSRTAASMGRSFFKCAHPKDSGAQCDFFQVRTAIHFTLLCNFTFAVGGWRRHIHKFDTGKWERRGA